MKLKSIQDITLHKINHMMNAPISQFFTVDTQSQSHMSVSKAKILNCIILAILHNESEFNIILLYCNVDIIGDPLGCRC